MLRSTDFALPTRPQPLEVGLGSQSLRGRYPRCAPGVAFLRQPKGSRTGPLFPRVKDALRSHGQREGRQRDHRLGRRQ